MCVRILVILLTLIASSAPSAAKKPVPPAWPGAVAYEGEHYHFTTDVEPALARDLLKMLDAQHGRLLDIFGKAPKTKGLLKVRLFRRYSTYQRLVARSGGGMYTYGNRTANVWVQPHLYWTRHLLLHETTHQWILLTFAKNRALLPWWLNEGFAEYCGFHVWDGETLTTEHHDVITLMDYPAKAREILEAPGWNVSRTFAGGVSGDRAEAWALIHYLMTTDPRKRKKLLRLLAEIPRKVHVENREKVEETSRALFRKIVSRKLDDVSAAVREHAAAMTRTWSILTIAWDRRGEVIEGHAKSTGVLRYVKESLGETAEISFEYRVLDGAKGWVGLAHRIRNARHFDVVTLKNPRRILWHGLRPTGWVTHGSGGKTAPRDREWHRVVVRFLTGKIEVEVDGESVAKLKRKSPEALGTVGLFLDAAKAEFRKFRVTSR